MTIKDDEGVLSNHVRYEKNDGGCKIRVKDWKREKDIFGKQKWNVGGETNKIPDYDDVWWRLDTGNYPDCCKYSDNVKSVITGVCTTVITTSSRVGCMSMRSMSRTWI